MPVREMVRGKLYVEFPSMTTPKQFSLYQHKLIEFETKKPEPVPVVIAIGRDQVQVIERPEPLENNDIDAYNDQISKAYWLSVECGL
jgi:hypothetical protein